MRKRLLAAGAFVLVLLGLLAGWCGLSRTRSQWRVVLVIPDPPPEPRHGWRGGVFDHAAVFSPDGKSVLVSRMGSGLERWDLASGSLERIFEPGDPNLRRFSACDWSSDGALVAGLTGDGAGVWAADEGRLLWGDSLSQCTGLAFSPDGTRLAVFGHRLELQIRDARSGESLRTLEIRQASGDWRALAWSPSGRYLLACDSIVCIVWDVDTGEERLRRRCLDIRQPAPHFRSLDDPMRLSEEIHFGECTGAAFLPDESAVMVFYSGYHGYLVDESFVPRPDGTLPPNLNRVRTYSLQDQRTLLDVTLPASLLHGALSHDGTRFAVAYWHHPVEIYDAAAGRLLQTCEYEDEDDDAYKVFWTPDDAQIVAFEAFGGSDGYPFFLFDASTGRRLEVRNEHGSPLFDVRFTPDGRRMVTTDHNLTHRIWERQS